MCEETTATVQSPVSKGQGLLLEESTWTGLGDEKDTNEQGGGWWGVKVKRCVLSSLKPHPAVFLFSSTKVFIPPVSVSNSGLCYFKMRMHTVRSIRTQSKQSPEHMPFLLQCRGRGKKGVQTLQCSGKWFQRAPPHGSGFAEYGGSAETFYLNVLSSLTTS